MLTTHIFDTDNHKYNRKNDHKTLSIISLFYKLFLFFDTYK